MEQVHFLCHAISENGSSVDPAKIAVVVDWHRLPNIYERRSFLGMAGYCQRFVKDFSRIATPLARLLRKDHQFKWTDEYDTSFQELKQRLITTPILTIPEGNEGNVVYSDASRRGLGCV